MFEPDRTIPSLQPTIPSQPHRPSPDPSLSQRQRGVSPPAPSHVPAGAVQRLSTRPGAPARPTYAAQPTTPHMSKAEALAFVKQCKQWLVAGCLVTFSMLTGLVAGHVIGSSTSYGNSTTGPSPSSNQTTPASPSSNPSPSSPGSFFPQQGGRNFGNGNLPQPPVSSSHTS